MRIKTACRHLPAAATVLCALATGTAQACMGAIALAPATAVGPADSAATLCATLALATPASAIKTLEDVRAIACRRTNKRIALAIANDTQGLWLDAGRGTVDHIEHYRCPRERGARIAIAIRSSSNTGRALIAWRTPGAGSVTVVTDYEGGQARATLDAQRCTARAVEKRSNNDDTKNLGC